MARKTEENNVHEFTRQIHSTKRAGTEFANMKNWDEKQAKIEEKLCCHDCRWFIGGWSSCADYIGKYHKTCKNFEWD